MKTNKSYSKRLRITRTGKIMARRPGKNHFNAKQSGRKQLAGNRSQQINLPHKAASRLLVNL